VKRFVTYLVLFLVCAVFADAGTIARVTKSATGTTEFGASSVLSSTELNGDFNVIVNEINGNLSNANVVSGADITTTKVGDESATAAAQDADTTPGDYTSRSLPTTLSGEIQTLRYKLSQAMGVQPCTRVNGSGSQDVGWVDLPVNGPNLVANASFAIDDDANGIPDPWAGVGASAGGLVSSASTAEGFGNIWTITGDDNEGVSYTFDELKGSTRYLIHVRASLTSGDADITTTGADAASEWRNIDLDLSGSAFADYCAVIDTDATPTNIVVSILGDGATFIGAVRDFGVYELSAIPRANKRYYQIETDADSGHAFPDGVDTATDATLTVLVPDIGYVVKVTADGSCSHDGATGASIFSIDLEEDGTDLGDALLMGNVALTGTSLADRYYPFSITRISENPAKGNHTYRLAGESAGEDWDCVVMTLTVEMIPF
jgi:hypothetical protein